MTSFSLNQLELENKRLREALVFAERGWRDALAFVNNQTLATTQSRPEDLLEIKSLQYEVNMLQRQILKRAQMADEFQRALTRSTDELDQITDKLMVSLHAECPAVKTVYAPPLWTVEFPSDSEVSSSSQIMRLGRTLRRLQAVGDWVREHDLEKFPHYATLVEDSAKDPIASGTTKEDAADKKSKKVAKKKKSAATAKGGAASEEGSVVGSLSKVRTK